ncbi:MAG TPA: type II toxin-antitoxin system Phd/YefM family antitoxin [Ktedonobacteraceae bacterium]|jgi:prevent-host-death family protein
MRQVNIHQAKTHLSQLLEDVARGEEIVIAKAGKPIARLVAVTATSQPRQRGLLKGRITIATNFDAPLPEEILTSFEGDL